MPSKRVMDAGRFCRPRPEPAFRPSTVRQGAACAVDGSTGERLVKRSVTHTALNRGAWSEVDFGANGTIVSLASRVRASRAGATAGGPIVAEG